MAKRLSELLARLRRGLETRPPRTPTILQMEAVECGAACLAIVLAHFGRWVPLERLRTDCGVSRDGSKASNIVKAARRYGLVAQGFKREPAGLRQLPGPMILHWNFNHFVVLEGIRRGRAYLNDPAAGPLTVSEEELDRAFTGVVLVFQPGPDFEAGGDRRSLVTALRRRLVGMAPALAFLLLAGLALVIPGLIAPVFTRVFVDDVLLDGRHEWLNPLLLAMGITALVVGGLTWLQQSYLLRLETRLAVVGSVRFLWHLLRLPMEFYNQRMAGDLSARVAINDRVAQLLSRDLATNAFGVLTLAFFALVLFRYDVLLTLIGFGVVSLNVLALRFVARRRIDGARRLQQEQGKLQGVAVAGLRSIETLKATGGEGDLFTRWAGHQAKVVNIRQDLDRVTEGLLAVPPLLTSVNTALILGVGSLRVMNGALTLGALLAFQILMEAFVQPVARLVGLGGNLQTAQGDMDRLDDVLRYPVQGDLLTDASAAETAEGEPVRLSGHLELRSVTFGYNELGPPLIEGLDLLLEPGSRVALVGGSGSGKSTIARLVAGLYEPWEGEILFDGRRRSELSRSVLTRSLAVVDQSIFLFAGTVRDNLSLWDATVPLPDLVAACRDAEIHDDVVIRPGGYEAEVSEGGGNWSGGQQQRLEITRALVGRPSLLVLDEATSALDASTEKRIDENLRRRGCTCLIIAHRLSTIRDADEIVVLDRGKVIQRGRHEELLAAGGAYADLIATE